MPQRIQRKRTKGWRMPLGAVYVGRPTKWGNPFTVAEFGPILAVEYYRTWFNFHRQDLQEQLSELRGRDLVCWCWEGTPCHADLLLQWANQGEKDESLP